MPQKPFRLFIFFVLLSIKLSGQSGFIPYSSEYYHLIDRFEVKSGYLSNDFHDNVKPFERKRVLNYLNSVPLDSMRFTKVDSFNLSYLKNDNWEWDSIRPVLTKKPLLKVFFKEPADFYHYKNDDFDIHVNPILNFGGGSNSSQSEKQGQFINTRGIRIRGSVNNKLGFYTLFTENQESSPFYVREYSLGLDGYPYNGFTKIVNGDSVAFVRDYIQAEGYMVFYPSRHIMLKMGHSKNFVGSGMRSMILSDFSSPYFNFQASVRLGRLEYMNILAKMNNRQEDFSVADLEVIPPKFMVFHHLNVNVTKNFNLGLFETVMFGNRKFDMNYLNPVIFYRFVEGLVGSSDNAIVGADFKLNLLKSISFYGQLILDEFNRKENQKEGWYGQKNAGQLGLKYIDAFTLKQFDIQGEFNYARPYTYSHYTTYSNLVNYNLPIAHPLGANFREFIVKGRYQPINRLYLRATHMWNSKGYDDALANWGGDITRNYREDRPLEFGNQIGQGFKIETSLTNFEASYMLWHNLFLDSSFQMRRQRALGEKLTKENLFKFGLRWNAFQNDYLF